MKLVDRRSAWGKATKRKSGPINLSQLNLDGARGFKNAAVPFANNLTAVCGENGAGKSTLLLSIFYALAPEAAVAEFPQLKKLSEELALKISAAIWNEATKQTEELSGDDLLTALKERGTGGSVVYLDAAELAQKLKRTITRDASFSTVLDGLAGKEASVTELDALAEFIGRRYEALTVFEVEDYSGWALFPYFQAKVGGQVYGSESMGMGELCINLIYWTLTRLSDGSVLLLEEPESHLPPRAQRALMSLVADMALRKKVYIVVTTHSSFTLEYVPTENVVMLGRNNEKVQVVTNPPRALLFESLQMSSHKRVAILFEDNIAKVFGREMILLKSPNLLEEAEFAFVNGYSDLDEVGGRWPLLNELRLVCAYDGDMRDRPNADKYQLAIFLPGKEDPALILRNCIIQHGNLLAQEIGLPEGPVQLALVNNSGTDLKDFFPCIKNALDIPMDRLVAASTRVWLSIGTNGAVAEQFCRELKDRI